VYLENFSCTYFLLLNKDTFFYGRDSVLPCVPAVVSAVLLAVMPGTAISRVRHVQRYAVRPGKGRKIKKDQ
jgi:hypothetical protein